MFRIIFNDKELNIDNEFVNCAYDEVLLFETSDEAWKYGLENLPDVDFDIVRF
jgi:hypothetical protein